MLFNYLKLSLRLMVRNPFFTFINVAGLSVGFTAFYILWPYAQNELKSDRFHQNYEQIARLSRVYEFEENGAHHRYPLPMHNSGIARQFVRDYPEITDLTGIIPQQFFETYRQGFDKDVFVSVESRNGDRIFFREYNLAYADSNFFQFFSFPLLRGNPEEVLRQPNTAVVSASHALKYFGAEDPVNKTIYFNDTIPFLVKGVYKDFPRNTHIKADVILSTAGIQQMNLTSFEANWWGYYYIKAAAGTDFNALENKINADRERIYGVCLRCPENSITSVFIQPLKTVVFTNLLANTFNYKSEYLLLLLSVLAFVIPVLAWINYICLSMHMLQKRMSELSVRKVVGAGHRHFIAQFMVEATLLNTLSFFVALTLIQLVKSPLENWVTFYTMPWSELPHSTVWTIAIFFAAGIIVTSSYPIVITLSKKAVPVKKSSGSASGTSWINLILTAQYSVALVLIICIMCVYFQLDFILSKPLGIDKDGIVVLDCPLQQPNDFRKKLTYFTTTAATLPGIQGTTVSKNVLGEFAGYGVPLILHKDGVEFGFDINGGVDENFLPVYKIKLLYGRNFQSDMPADKNAILVSRATTVLLGFPSPEKALGVRVFLPWYNRDDAEIIGVYEDYEFRPRLLSFAQHGRGSFMSYGNYLMPDLYPSKISVRVNYETFSSSLSALEKLFKEVFPNDTFHWTFLDDKIQSFYLTDKVAQNQIGVFTLIAIGIACLGLLGMISNKVVEKTKEIGIRKVLGAGLLQIAHILLKTTTSQMVIAALISIPAAYFIVSQYLEKFSERIILQWWHFVLPLAMLVLIMFVTIASVLWKAAKSNPVEALKYE
ncbi:MAG: ABC transporter permease [Cyclobacteriaceae bacterium]|nr:ABC transporter permease [Cyclobacteriaceae bacterium]